MALEGPNNEQLKEGLVKLRDNLKAKYEMTDDDYKVLEVLIEERKPHKTGPQWKFAGSLYYAFVTLALIGKRELSDIVLTLVSRLRSLHPLHHAGQGLHHGLVGPPS